MSISRLTAVLFNEFAFSMNSALVISIQTLCEIEEENSSCLSNAIHLLVSN